MADTAGIAAAMRANPTRNMMSGMGMSNRLRLGAAGVAAGAMRATGYGLHGDHFPMPGPPGARPSIMKRGMATAAAAAGMYETYNGATMDLASDLGRRIVAQMSGTERTTYSKSADNVQRKKRLATQAHDLHESLAFSHTGTKRKKSAAVKKGRVKASQGSFKRRNANRPGESASFFNERPSWAGKKTTSTSYGSGPPTSGRGKRVGALAPNLGNLLSTREYGIRQQPGTGFRHHNAPAPRVNRRRDAPGVYTDNGPRYAPRARHSGRQTRISRSRKPFGSRSRKKKKHRDVY